MSKTALVVTFDLIEGKKQAFIDCVTAHGQRCLEREPGCLRFDIIIPHNTENRVLLYEVYADDSALDAHDKTEYIASFRQDASEFVKDRERVQCTLIEK